MAKEVIVETRKLTKVLSFDAERYGFERFEKPKRSVAGIVESELQGGQSFGEPRGRFSRFALRDTELRHERLQCLSVGIDLGSQL